MVKQSRFKIKNDLINAEAAISNELENHEKTYKQIKNSYFKERFDDVASPTQMQNYLKQVDELILFRTKAVTIFAIVQFAMALAIAMIKLG